MHHRLREVLLKEQDTLTNENKSHGKIYYFSKELAVSRKGLREFIIPTAYRQPEPTYRHLMQLFQNQQILPSPIQIIYGQTGIGKSTINLRVTYTVLNVYLGKTHRINNVYKTDHTLSFSINDKLNLSLLISSFLSFDSKTIHHQASVFFNISMHAPFEFLNRTLFSLFICGSLNDTSSGLMFSLPQTQPSWRFIIEVPYSNAFTEGLEESFYQILPLIAIFSPSTLEEVTSDNYPLHIGNEERVVAKFLKAFEDRSIDRDAIPDSSGKESAVSFPDLTNVDECRRVINHCMRTYASELPRNKIFELSFTKFLYRRIRFFEGHYYCWNQHVKNLGSTAMRQMINEATALTRIDFSTNYYPRVYLVYDPGFSLHLLHTDWNRVHSELRTVFENKDPWKSSEYQNKDYFAECLAWLIDIPYETFMQVVKQTKFILTENFAYKLFHIHERKLTKLALIIEGGTGVGKTFLLKFYSLLLNAKSNRNSLAETIVPHILESSSKFILDIITTKVETDINLLNPFLQQIKPRLLRTENDNDENLNRNAILLPLAVDAEQQNQADAPVDMNLLREIKTLLETHQYSKNALYQIWRTILSIANEKILPVTSTLIQMMHDYVTHELTTHPQSQGTIRLAEFLNDVSSPSADVSIKIFNEYLFQSQIKPLFYRLLIHPGITEEQLVDFMNPIIQLARELPNVEIVVFFDEVNTSSCLGLFKEMFMDGTFHATTLPKNIFFTAAINPWIDPNAQNTAKIHRTDFIVHKLPHSLEDLKVKYGTLESATLADYIVKKIRVFQITFNAQDGKQLPLDRYFHDTFADSILKAQEFCEKRLGKESINDH